MSDEKQTSSAKAEPPTKEYLGDGVYARFDGYSIQITTENGIETTNDILLEPEVYRALRRYAARCGQGAAGRDGS